MTKNASVPTWARYSEDRDAGNPKAIPSSASMSGTSTICANSKITSCITNFFVAQLYTKEYFITHRPA